MRQTIILYGLYLIYYFLIPIVPLILVWMIWKKDGYIRNLKSYGDQRTKKSEETIRKNERTLKKLQIGLVIFIVLSIPAINFTFYGIQEESMDRQRVVRGAFGESQIFHPLEAQFGPSSDVDSVLESMREDTRLDWHVDEIEETIDLDEISHIPGRLTAYYLTKREPRREKIVLTYSYYSPVPITRIYGFRLLEVDSEEHLDLAEEKTIFYPRDPANADPFD